METEPRHGQGGIGWSPGYQFCYIDKKAWCVMPDLTSAIAGTEERIKKLLQEKEPHTGNITLDNMVRLDHISESKRYELSQQTQNFTIRRKRQRR